MKLRTGFVSNSSSSSFIVSAKKGKTPTVIVEIELPINKTIETVGELNEHFIEYWVGGDCNSIEELMSNKEVWNKHISDQYNNCLKELKRGNVIYMGTVANDSGNSVEEILYDRGIGDNKLKNGKIIQDCQR